MGQRKLYHELQVLLEPHEMELSRHKLHKLLKANDLLIKPVRKQPKTTQSLHRYRKWPNLIKGAKAMRPEEIVVADITYWRIERGFIYLALITDTYSHMVLGYNISKDLFVSGALAALVMMLKARVYPQKEMIHHSDRGTQYCSNVYVGTLQDHGIGISMTQGDHAGENTVAERINGILKQDFGLPDRFADYESAVEPISEAIKTYNYEYPHGSINYLKPYQAHRISGPIKRRWSYKKDRK